MIYTLISAIMLDFACLKSACRFWPCEPKAR